jgi:hypothetical protein
MVAGIARQEFAKKLPFAGPLFGADFDYSLGGRDLLDRQRATPPETGDLRCRRVACP